MNARVLLGAAVVALTACAPTASDFDVTPLGSAVVHCPVLPASVELGQVPVGGHGSAVVTVAPQFEVQLGDASAFSLQREGDEVRVDVQPALAGPLETTLTATAPGCQPSTARVLAEGVARCLDLASTLSFPQAERSCGSITATLNVHNRCDVAVSLHGGQVVEPADGAGAWCPGGPPCQEFGLVGGASVVGPGATATLTLRFSPANTGARSGAFHLVASERNGLAEYVVTLDGNGQAYAPVTEQFVVPDQAYRGDLFVIIDSSPSMIPRRESTAQNFHAYGLYLQSSQMDVQVHVASADRALAGTAVGTTNSRDPDFQTKFAQLIDAVPPGTEDTSCMEQALALLEASPPLRRPELNAAILCVTDGPDRAPAPWPTLLGRFTKRIDTPLVSVIGPFSEYPGCDTELDNGRLASWVDSRWSVKEDICVPDWSGALVPITKAAFGSYFSAAVSGSVLRVIGVTVDGVPLAPFDSRGAKTWEWDGAGQAVVFEPLYVPEAGQVVGVTYEPSCP